MCNFANEIIIKVFLNRKINEKKTNLNSEIHKQKEEKFIRN